MNRLFIILFTFVLAVSSLFTFDFTVEAKEYPQKVTFLYFNDAHEMSPVVNQYGDRGGLARLKTIIDRTHEDNKHTIVSFGGDLGGGTLFGGVFQGFPIVEGFNKMGIDVANFGQHDFDFGSDVTKQLVDASHFQWMSSNLTDVYGNPFADVPTYKIYTLQGIKVGIISLTDDMNTTTQEGQVVQQDLIQSAKLAVNRIKEEKKIDVVIAMTQESLEKDELLLNEIPEIDAIFTEEKAENQSFINKYENQYILAPEGNIGLVIQLDILKKGKSIQLSPSIIKVDQTVPEDPEIKELADYYQDELEEKLGVTIAKLETPLSYGENHESRYQETNIGNFVADSYRHFFDADIGLMNGGGIRASIPTGDFTMRDAYSILPFRNKVLLANIKGETLRLALENGVSKYLGGGFLQVSGMNYTYDANKPLGERIQDIQINHDPIDLEKMYRVALPNYLFYGGDGYTMFSESELLVDESNARTDAEVLIEYAKQLEVINVEKEGRIVGL